MISQRSKKLFNHLFFFGEENPGSHFSVQFSLRLDLIVSNFFSFIAVREGDLLILRH